MDKAASLHGRPPDFPLRHPKLPPALHGPRLPAPAAARRRRAPEPGLWRAGLAAPIAAAAFLLAFAPIRPEAQPSLLGLGSPAQNNEPVTFTAGEVEYDQNSETVTARGRVEAWQGDRVLRADTFTYNRATGVAVAEGNVVLIEANGQILFTDRAELTGGMRDAVLEGVGGLLAGNARVAAAGARRTNGDITDLARVVYSACDLCPEDPDRPPLWQLRARIASLHSTEQRVRYRDAAVQFAGVPVLYTPYLSHASPDARRASGFLSPTFGNSNLLGLFVEQPYYWAIDEQSDLRVSTTVSTRQLPNLGGIYRRRFNNGELQIESSVGNLSGDRTDDDGVGGHVFANGRFSIDENWRAGFALNRASSRDYLRAYRYGSPTLLTSNAFLEGFWGTDGYARVDSRLYQSLASSASVNTAVVPFVLPFGYTEWVMPQDSLGGRFTLDASAYSIFRSAGTDTRRAATRASYELPLLGQYGEIWTLRAQADAMGGWADGIALTPTLGDPGADGLYSRANARAAIDWRLPLIRDAGDYGAHLIEPRVQLVTGPNTGSQSNFPNEDSLDLEFTDANLFSLNRFPGRDRLEGGTRADAALRAAWLFPNGGQLEGLAGRSFRADTDATYPTGSGLERHASDWVGRVRLAPVPWFELMGRARLDSQTTEPRLWDGTATFFGPRFTLSAGYFLTQPEPFVATAKREEVSVGGSVQITDFWRLGAFGRYDIARDRGVAGQVALTYEDECFIFETRFVRNRAENLQTGNEYASGTMLLFRIGLKTIGDFGIRAL